MKKLLLLILILVGVVFAGKVVIEKQYESKLDKAISSARGVVGISYDDVKIDLDGSISLNGLSITPLGYDQSIKAKRITVISSDRLLPIKGLKIFQDGNYPQTLEVNFRQLFIPTDLVEQSQQAYFSDRPKSQPCRSFLSSFNYSDAGYSRINSDIRMAFDLSDIANAIVNIEMFDQTSSFTSQWIFDANQTESLARRQSSELPVSEISATFELEPDAAQRFVEQCAEVFNVTPEIYLAKVVGSAKYSENSFGADLGPQMREALIKFMKGGSQFSFTSQPSSQLKKLEQLQFYAPSDVLRWMNLTLSIEGEPLALNATALATNDNDDVQSKGDVNKAANANQNRKTSEYFIVSALDAENYINRFVRIKRTNQRKSIEGRLAGIADDDRLMVAIHQYGGLTTLTVGFDEIVGFEVRKKIEPANN